MTTSLYAGILALIFILLSANVVKSRKRFRIALGDGDNQEIQRRVRAHGNFVEYSTIFIVLLAMAENNAMPSYLVHFFGIVFLLGRLMHAYSLLKAEIYVDGKIVRRPSWRMSGMVFTFTCIGSLGIILILQYFMRISGAPNIF